MKKQASTIYLKTNFFLNILKLLFTFIMFVILGVIAKVFPYYHLETVVLALIIGTTVWFYRLRYKGKLEYRGAVIYALMRINVFNHKVIRVSVNQGTNNFDFKYNGKSDSIEFEDNQLAFKIKVSADFKKKRTCTVQLLDR
ncbi:hypothetical protein [Agaribacter flavus]|uniref:Uncharacterized protein n=1 Tax=Agaribacter flavus TaxID=1902781 RepID=A0ABV7FQB7_9ALTE